MGLVSLMQTRGGCDDIYVLFYVYMTAPICEKTRDSIFTTLSLNSFMSRESEKMLAS